MSAQTTTMTPTYGAAKESLTPDEIVARAKGLKDLLRAEAAEGERLGRYTEKVHEAFLEAGLYHLLTPKRYNGYEFDTKTYLRVVIALAEADMGAAWNYALGHGHVLTTAAYWPQEAQDVAFNNPRGYFKAGHSLRPSGTATPVEGGYNVKGRSDYQSGISYASHATVYVRIEGSEGEKPKMVNALLPEGSFEILDNWSIEKVVGLAASGSNSVVFDTFVPEVYVRPETMAAHPLDDDDVPGLKLHGNAQYLAPSNTFRTLGLHAIMVGAARGAAVEYETITRAKKGAYVPFAPRIEDGIYQQDFWNAMTKADAAERLVLAVADEYMARVAHAVEAGSEYVIKDDLRLSGSAFEAGHLAAEAVQTALGTAGSGEVQSKGKYLEKLTRDLTSWRTHALVVRSGYSRTFGSFYLGSAANLFA